MARPTKSYGSITSSPISSLSYQRPQKTSGDFNADQLQRRIAAILQSDAPEDYKISAARLAPEASTKSTTGGGFWDAPLKGLQYVGATIDLPRRLVVSTLNKAITWGDSNWLGDVKKGTGVGDIIQKHGWDWLPDAIEKTPYLGDFTKGLIGFAGDVALDPLTYVGIGMADEVLKGGNKAARLFAEAGSYSRQLGKVDDATRFADAAQRATKGLSNLTVAEREVAQQLAASEAQRLGSKIAAEAADATRMSGGVYFNVPGTGNVSNAVRRMVGIAPVQKAQLQILKPSEALSTIPRGMRAAEEAVRKSALGQQLGKVFSESWKQNAVSALRRGKNADEILDGWAKLDALPKGAALETGFVRQAAAKLTPLLNDLERGGANFTDITKSAAGDENAFTRVVQQLGGDTRATELATQAREASRDLARMYNDMLGVAEGDDLAIRIYDLHASLQRSDDLIDYLQKQNKLSTNFNRTGVRGAGFERRNTRAGDEFLGQVMRHPTQETRLADGTVIAADSAGRSIPEQMDAAAREMFGDDYVEMFNMNFKDNILRQIQSMGRRLRIAGAEKRLRELGVAKSIYSQVLTPEALAAQTKLGSIIDRLPGARQQAAQEFLNVENAKEMLDDAERIVAGSKEQMAVYRAEARLARSQRELVNDPTLKGLTTRLRNVRDRKQLVQIYRSIQERVLQMHPDDAENILAPMRKAVEQAQREFDRGVGGTTKRLQSALDEATAKIERTIAYQQQREHAIGLYTSLAQRGGRWKTIVEGLIDETIDPFRVGSPEYNQVTQVVASDLEAATSQLKQVEKYRSMLYSTLMGPAGRDARADAELAAWLFIRHPKSGLPANQIRVIEAAFDRGGSQALDDLILKAADNVVNSYRKEIANYKNILDARVNLTRNQSLELAAREMRSISDEMRRLGEDNVVAQIGRLDAKLPAIDSAGNLVNRRSFMRPEAVIDQDLFDYEMEIIGSFDFENAALNTLRDDVMQQIDDLYSEIDEFGVDAVLENPEIQGILDDWDDFRSRMMTMNAWEVDPEVTAAEFEFLTDLNRRLGDPRKFETYDVYHGTGTGINLTKINRQHNYPNADSMLGLHVTSDIRYADKFAETGLAAQRDRIGRRARGKIVARMQIAPKNIKIYGPKGVDFRYGSILNFDQLPQGYEWFGGRAALNGDMLRSAVQQGAITRDDIPRLASRLGKTSDRSQLQERFWNSVFDAFEVSQDAGAALRQAAQEAMVADPGLRKMMDDLIAHTENVTTRAADAGRSMLERYDDEIVDYISGHMMRAGNYAPAFKNVPDVALRIPDDMMRKIVDSFRESMVRQGYDSVAYVLDPSVGWATIVLDPSIVKMKTPPAGYASGIRRTYKIPGLGKVSVKGRKAIGFDLFDQRQAFYNKFIKEHEDTLNKYTKIKEQLGVRIDEMSADFEQGIYKISQLEQDLADVTARLDEAYKDGVQRSELLLGEEAHLRTRALELQRAIDDRMKSLQAEIDAVDVDLQTKIDNVEAVRAELGIAQLEADYATAVADYNKAYGDMIDLENLAVSLRQQGMEKKIVKVIENGYRQLGMRSQAPSQIVEAIEVFAKIRDPQQVGMFLKTFDGLSSFFKSYAVATPGFHTRNFFGGVWNNWLAGVDNASYRAFRKVNTTFEKSYAAALEKPIRVVDGQPIYRNAAEAYDEAMKAVTKKHGQRYAEAYDIAHRSNSLFTAGQISSVGIESGIAARTGSLKETLRGNAGRKLPSRLTDNPATRLNMHASEWVEHHLRGTLAFDYALKGSSRNDILDAVYKFHFNYDDLSNFERSVGKRLFPFYTWTRKNLPLQLEMMITQPKWFNRQESFKRNMETVSPEEPIVPLWFTKTFNVRMPFTTGSGDRVYMMPALPSTDLARMVGEPMSILGNLNPLVKVPIEARTQTRLYNQVPYKEGKVEIPTAWNYLGVGFALSLIGRAELNKEGKLVAKDSDLGALESYLPILSRARRLFPADTESEDKYTRRVAWSWINAVAGLGLTAVTPEDKSIEMWRRSKEVDKINKELETMGFGGFRELSREVPVSRNPRRGERRPAVIVTQRRSQRPSSSYRVPRKGETSEVQYREALQRISSDNRYSKELQDMVRKIQSNRQA